MTTRVKAVSSMSDLPKSKRLKRDINGSMDSAKTLKKKESNHSASATECKHTPTTHNSSNPTSKRNRSSMRKIKKFLKNRSKKKLACESPSVEQLQRGSTARVKSQQICVDSPLESRKSVKRKSVDAEACELSLRRSLRYQAGDKVVSQYPHQQSCDQSVTGDEKCEVSFMANVRHKTTNSPAGNTSLLSVVSATRQSAAPYNSTDEACKLFAYMIEPVTPAKFFRDIWEKKPLLVRRHSPLHNDGWFSNQQLDQILHEESVNFTEHIDVVTYLNGKRETHNPTGRAYAPLVWDFYQTGCSVRLLNPHRYSTTVWNALSLLQEYFGCVAGANVYLTPPGSQGFAPHWDDIEAFILQLEGKKHWRVYEPRNEAEILPRFSSENFTDADLPAAPVLDTILEPGDLLYFPRGFIHQGETLADSHSLHITVSVGQKNTWADLLEKLLPRALELARDDDVEFRKSLPRDYFNYMGVAFSDETSAGRSKFVKNIEHLMTKLLTSAPVDAACDQMAKEYLQNTLPPVLNDEEKQCSIHGAGERWDPHQQRVRCTVEIEPDTDIKLIRRLSVRLVVEDDKVFVYHNIQNERTLHGTDVQCLEVEPQMAEGVEFLLKHYPQYIAVDDLPLDTVQERVALAVALYDRGLIMTRGPLETLSDDDTSVECSQSD